MAGAPGARDASVCVWARIDCCYTWNLGRPQQHLRQISDIAAIIGILYGAPAVSRVGGSFHLAQPSTGDAPYERRVWL